MGVFDREHAHDRPTQNGALPMIRVRARRLAALVFSPVLAGAIAMASTAGCSSTSNDQGAADDANDQALSDANKFARWIYDGPLPTLDSDAEPTTMTVSQKAHTLLVTGILPKTFTGQLPYYVDTDQVTLDGE